MITLEERTEIEQENTKSFVQHFDELDLSSELSKAIEDMGFKIPSEIQQAAIPQIFKGEDIIAMAPTGSGKTATFAIPVIEKINRNSRNIEALILCPTRELAIQCHKEFEKMTKYMDSISVVSIYGGQNIEKQLNALTKNPQIVVATPGRLMDHLRRNSLNLSNVKTVVLDEADEMLDMGFREDIYTILEDVSTDRQTILFSATMAKDILELTKKIQRLPNIIDVTDNLSSIPDIAQTYFEVTERDKVELLIRLLTLHNINLSLVFCNTKANVDKVVETLKQKGIFADSIHGDLNQNQREKVMQCFRKKSIKVLVATDVAGRGIDVKDIEAVFNYDLPRDDEDYIHRVGRTGRAGKSGLSFTFVSKRQVSTLKKIEKANGIKIEKNEIPNVEELDKARFLDFSNKIRKIAEQDDLTKYKNDIEAMQAENLSITDIAAALLKFATSKEGKKINRNVVFEVPEEEIKKDRGFNRNFRKRNDRRKTERAYSSDTKKKSYKSKNVNKNKARKK